MVGAEVARHLNADFSILVSRKLPHPVNPETGFGAVAKDASLFNFEDAQKWLSKLRMEEIVSIQKQVIQERIATLRKNKQLPNMGNRVVILVDDGIAMGSTVIVSMKFCKNKNSQKIILAGPVAGSRVAREFEIIADDLIVLEIPARLSCSTGVFKFS
jgi:predicted phosphoribosyltransferase